MSLTKLPTLFGLAELFRECIFVFRIPLGSHIAFSHHVSLLDSNLGPFLCLSLSSMTLNILKSSGHIVERPSIWVYLMFSPKYTDIKDLGKNITGVMYPSHLSYQWAHNVNMANHR